MRWDADEGDEDAVAGGGKLTDMARKSCPHAALYSVSTNSKQIQSQITVYIQSTYCYSGYAVALHAG